MSQYLIDQIRSTPNIEVLTRHEVIEAHGVERLEALTIRNSATDTRHVAPAAALFLFIGGCHTPR